MILKYQKATFFNTAFFHILFFLFSFVKAANDDLEFVAGIYDRMAVILPTEFSVSIMIPSNHALQWSHDHFSTPVLSSSFHVSDWIIFIFHLTWNCVGSTLDLPFGIRAHRLRLSAIASAMVWFLFWPTTLVSIAKILASSCGADINVLLFWSGLPVMG